MTISRERFEEFTYGMPFVWITKSKEEIRQLIRSNFLHAAKTELLLLKECLHTRDGNPDAHRARLDDALAKAKATYQVIGTSEKEVSQLVAECHRLIAQKTLQMLQTSLNTDPIPAIIDVCHHTAHAGVSLNTIEACAKDDRQLIAV
ncbi:hypothetical protein HY065_00610 [Candidatus Berkelbacteria bacterium]|nr:hypothetical protein [Candidatus Berkelbacteria bacterium]